MSWYKTAKLKTSLSKEVYEFLRAHGNVIIRADGSSVVYCNIYVEVEPDGTYQALLPSPYDGTEMLNSYLKDSNEPSPRIKSGLYEEVVTKKVGKGDYKYKEGENPFIDGVAHLWAGNKTKENE